MFRKELIKMKEEIVTIIEEGRLAGLGSEVIVNSILDEAIIGRDIVVIEGARERPLQIREVVMIVRKALEQAEFEGAAVVLPTGERIRRR